MAVAWMASLIIFSMGGTFTLDTLGSSNVMSSNALTDEKSHALSKGYVLALIKRCHI